MKNYYYFIAMLVATFSLVAFTPYFTGYLNLKAISAGQTGALLAQMTFYAVIVERVTEILVKMKYSEEKKMEKIKVATEAGAFKTAQAELAAVNVYTPSAAPMIATLSQKVDDTRVELQRVKALNNTDIAEVELKAKAKKFAILTSTVLGILLALIGVRIFGTLSIVEASYVPDKTTIKRAISAIPSLAADQDAVVKQITTALSEIKETQNGTVDMQPFQQKFFRGLDVIFTGILLAGGAAGLHPLLNSFKPKDEV